jgi:hypothetical protein
VRASRERDTWSAVVAVIGPGGGVASRIAAKRHGGRPRRHSRFGWIACRDPVRARRRLPLRGRCGRLGSSLRPHSTSPQNRASGSARTRRSLPRGEAAARPCSIPEHANPAASAVGISTSKQESPAVTRVGLGGRSPASFGLAYSRAATAPAQVASRHYASTGNAGLLAASHQARYRDHRRGVAVGKSDRASRGDRGLIAPACSLNAPGWLTSLPRCR